MGSIFIRCLIRTLDGCLGSANATSELCHPPINATSLLWGCIRLKRGQRKKPLAFRRFVFQDVGDIDYRVTQAVRRNIFDTFLQVLVLHNSFHRSTICATSISWLVLYFASNFLSRPLFGLSFFLGSLFLLQLTNFENGDKKQERRRKSMHRSIPHSLDNAQRPAIIDSQQFLTEKGQVCPGI